MIVTITNTKGGTGKSNLSAHLVIWLRERGIAAALLDVDHEQLTSSKWLGLSDSHVPVAVAGNPSEIKLKLAELKAGNQVVVIDTPGSASPAAFTATMLADVAIVPATVRFRRVGHRQGIAGHQRDARSDRRQAARDISRADLHSAL